VSPLQRKVLETGEWRPDAPDLGNSGLTAQNVIPWPGGYKSFPSVTVVSDALDARVQGGYFARDDVANVYNLAGTSTKLYQQVAGSVDYVDVSRSSGGAYATATDDWWEMAQWGATVIATNYFDDPQVLTLGAANFTALGGTPPKARHIAVIRDFVVLGNINDGTAYPNRVRWSAINNSASWAVSAATQADYQDLQGDGGWVQKIVGGEYGLVFQERAVWKVSYIGSPVIFQFDMIERARGAWAPQSVIGWGAMTFFLAEDGFYMILGGSAAIPIGEGKVDKTFLADVKTAYNYRINAAIDPTNKIVMWAYPGAGSTDGTCNKIIIYNWAIKRWSIVTGVSLEAFTRWASTGYTLEGLDAVDTNIDTLMPSLDSRVWTGGAQSLGAFDSNHQFNTIDGDAMDATVDTGEVQLVPGRRAEVQWARPLTDGNAASVAMRSRIRLADTASYGSASSQNSSGVCPIRSNGRYHAARTTTTGEFNFIQGVEVEFSEAGER
jgi:hypothetical protein